MLVEAVPVAVALTSELRRRLLSGSYEGGQVLRDTELAVEFGVARPTVRTAVQTLVAEGLLERPRGRSARVRGFTAADAVDVYELRRAVELAAVTRVVAGRVPLELVADAAASFAALPPDADWAAVADADLAFHRAVLVAAGSPRLLRTFDEVGAEMRLLVAQLRAAYASVADLAAEHTALLEVLRSGGRAAVLRAWREHLDAGERDFATMLEERP